MHQCIKRMLITITKQMWQFISTQTIFALCDLYWVGLSHCKEGFLFLFYTIFALCDLYWVGVSRTHVTNFSLPSFSMWGHIRPPCTIQPHITTMLLQARIYTFNFQVFIIIVWYLSLNNILNLIKIITPKKYQFYSSVNPRSILNL